MDRLFDVPATRMRRPVAVRVTRPNGVLRWVPMPVADMSSAPGSMLAAIGDVISRHLGESGWIEFDSIEAAVVRDAIERPEWMPVPGARVAA